MQHPISQAHWNQGTSLPLHAPAIASQLLPRICCLSTHAPTAASRELPATHAPATASHLLPRACCLSLACSNMHRYRCPSSFLPAFAACPLHAPTCTDTDIPRTCCLPLACSNMRGYTHVPSYAPSCARPRTLLRRCMSHSCATAHVLSRKSAHSALQSSTQPIHVPMEISPYITPSANTAHYVVAHMLHLPGSVPFHKNMPPNMPHVCLAPPHQVTVHAGATPPSHGPCHFPYSQIRMSQ
ncbi:hypothetical protein ACOSQ4_013621 [Xanthoceras sorbifolium]